MLIDALKGGVYVAGVQVRKSGWIQVTSLWQSTTVVTIAQVSTTGAVDEVPHPDKKMSPTRGRRKNNLFMGKQQKNKWL